MSGLLFLGQTLPMLGNPTGGTVVAGAATIGPAGPSLTINQSTQNAIINWQQFSIANGEVTKFVVPNFGATLNRVTGGNPSAIYGTLQSNGTLYLVNPSGIVVGASGRIDTASFLATTLDVSNEQFLKGGSLNLAGSSDAAINNEGTIHATTGDVYLIASQVNNNGTLSAPQGTVGLAAGNDVIFQQAGSQNLFVQATPPGTKRALGVTNAGTIHAAAAELTAAGGNAYALAINNTGVIAATGYKKINGQVFLTSDGGSISNSGKISAKQANGNGGKIVIDGTAKKSSTSGTVTNSGTLNASATVAGGAGGTVTLKNMGGTVVHSGKILARGGQGGTGGNAEISGADMIFTGAIDLRALGGTTGNLLLDPATVNIVTGGGSNVNASTIDPSALVAALDGANITLTGTTSITVTNLVDASANGSAGDLILTTPKLTLNAPIVLASGSTLSGSATTLSVGAGGSIQNAVDAASTTTTPTITLATGATYDLTSEILINKSLTLNGANAILDGSNGAGAGNGVTRVMEIEGTSTGVTVTLNNLTLENGNAAGPGTDDGYGGGLLVFGYNGLVANATLNSSTVTGNTSSYDGGGIYVEGDYGSAFLTLTGSTISNNTAGIVSSGSNGGGIYSEGVNGSASVTISANTTLTGNSAPAGSGGIYNYDGALILGVAGNTTFTVSAPIFNVYNSIVTVAPGITTIAADAPVTLSSGSTSTSSASTVNVGAGSGLENGYLVQAGVNLAGPGATVTLTSGTTYNLDSTTGEIVIDQNLTLNGNGAIIDGSAGAGAGNGTTRVMEIVGTSSGVTVNLNNVTLENGNASSGGTDDGYGGGLLVFGYNGLVANANLTNTTVKGNTSSYDGGAIYVEGDYGNASLTLTGSTISNNTAGIVSSGSNGGGIYSEGVNGSASVTISANTTLTGNSAPAGSGGIYNYDGALILGVAGNTTFTVNYPIDSVYYSTVTVAPGITTVTASAPVTLFNNSTSTSSASTVNVSAGSGLENGYLVQAGVNLAAPGATVNLASGTTYNLDGTTGQVLIGHSLTLNGNGAILDGSAGAGAGNGTTRVMEITGANTTVTLNNVKLENGNGGGSDDNGDGGGLLVYGYNTNQVSVTLNNSTVSGNTSSYDGGGIYVDGYYGNATLNLISSTISNNTAGVYSGGNGGGIFAQAYGGTSAVTVTNSSLTGNSAPLNGSGIYTAYSALTLATTGSTTMAITYPIYSTDNSSLTISPNITAIDLDATVISTGGSTLTSSATTVYVGAVTGSENGYVVLSAATLLNNGGTISLASGTTYNFDGTTGSLGFSDTVNVAGNGATLNGQGDVSSIVTVYSGADVTLSNMTITGATGVGLFNFNGGTLTVNGCTITGNGGNDGVYYNGYGYSSPEGGIYNNGTLQLGAGTTITANTGYSTGGIYNDNYGTINGTVTDAQAFGNTATQGQPENVGTDFYNQGTGTFTYIPDGGTGTTSTVTGSAYSSGSNAVVVVDPSVTTLVVDAPVNVYNSATVVSSVPVVNIGVGSGTNNAALIQGGIVLAGSGATVNLASGTTYNFDNTTSNLNFTGTVNVAGHGATLNGQGDVSSIVTVYSGADVTLSNMTITGSTGVGLFNFNGGTLTVNGCTITGNGGTDGVYYNGYGYSLPEGGIYNNGTLQLGAGTTITANTGYYTGGIFNDNYGVINGTVTDAQAFGNTATLGQPQSEGTDFYNEGTGTFTYIPDGGTGTTSTVTGSAYSSGSNAVVVVDPSVTTLVVDAPVNVYNNATVVSSVPVVNIGVGSGTNNAALIQGGIVLAGSGATVNLASGTTYNFDNTTSNLNFTGTVNVAGHGATLNGQGDVSSIVTVYSGADVTLSNMTITGSTGVGLFNFNGGTLTVNGCTITGNGGTGGVYYNGYGYSSPEGGIYNNGTLQLGAGTTITANTGYSTGGIFNDNYGVINGTVSSGQVYGNTATLGQPQSEGTDFYNEGTGTFTYTPDGGTGSTSTFNGSTYSTGTGASVIVDPSVTTLDVEAPVNIYNGATVSSSATTVNIGPGSGTNNGFLIQGGITLTANGGTVNLTAGSTYLLDGSTGEIKIGQNLTLNGNGAVIDGSDGAGPGNGVTRVMEIDGTTSGVTVNLNNVTLENGNGAGSGANQGYNGGALLIYAESGNQATVTINNSTISGSNAYYAGGGFFNDAQYGGYASLTINNSTIADNTSNNYGGGGGYSTAYYGGTALLTVNGSTITGNSTGGNGGAVYNYSGYNGSATLAGTGNTVTGNSGYDNGGIYNSGSISGMITSTRLYGNTATDTNVSNTGADFYNIGTGTFVYKPDGGVGTTATINDSIYSSGTGAAITIDPSVTTINLNVPITSIDGATVTSSATTVNVGAGSGTDNGYLITGAAALVASGGTIHLPANTTYSLDNTTGQISISQSLTLQGNGSVIDGSDGAGPGNGVARVMEIDGTTSGVNVTLNDLTLENGNGAGMYVNMGNNGGALLIYAQSGNEATVTIDNSTISGSTAYYSGGGIFNDAEYGGYASLTINNSTITGNSAAYYGGGGVYNASYGSGTAQLTINNTTISGNTAANSYGAGVYNDGTAGSTTLAVNGGTITGNTGYYNGGLYNSGTLTGQITSTQVYGNTATFTTQSSTGADFYNVGTGTFVYEPDSVGSHTATINVALYSTGTGAVVTVDPTVTTLNVNAPVTSSNGATVNSSATTVNIGAGSGTNNGYLIQSGLTLASSGATLNLAPATTYGFDGSTGGLSIGSSLTLQGDGDTLNGENEVTDVINVASSGQTLTINNLTLENGDYGIEFSYENSGLTTTLNNVTVSGNTDTGIDNYYYYGYANTLALNNCTITGNGSSGYGNAAGIFNYYGDTLNLVNSTISNNGNTTNPATAGGILNYGTISIDSATTVTGNTGYYAGGIDNNGTILGNVTSSHVHGNTATDTVLTNTGADFYNSGTATFVYEPDGEGTNLSITAPIYSDGTNAVITIDPSITGTLNLDAPFVSSNSATFTSSATTVNVNAPVVTQNGVFSSSAGIVNVAAGSGTENGYYVLTGLAFAGSGATVNLAAGVTYNFDSTTGGITITNGLTVQGNGSILNGQNSVSDLIYLDNQIQNLTLNNLTLENGTYGIVSYLQGAGATVTLNNVTLTGNSDTGIYAYDYDNSDTLNLNNCTITNNGGAGYSGSGGIYNYYNSTINLSDCTISGNGNTTEPGYVGGILNYGTMSIDSATTITGNTGYYAGGIYNVGTILGNVTSSQVHGNTEINTDLTNAGADFYNSGEGTFVYEPDGEGANLTITNPIHSSGTGAVITIDPSITGTLNLNTQFTSNDSATFNSSATTVNVNAPVVTQGGFFNSAATTVNVAAGSGPENGYYAQTGVAFAGNGATVNLATNATYTFDSITGGLSIGNNLVLQGNGATFNGQNTGYDVIDVVNTDQSVTLNNVTLENGNYGIAIYNPSNGLVATLNNVTVTGNAYSGIYNYNYDYADTLNVNNSTISNNGTGSVANGVGIFNYYNGTINLSNTTITGNGSVTNPSSAGGIENYSTVNLDSATTVTGNTGYYSGGIYNLGTILGNVTSTQVHGNTALNTDPTNIGTDFYNTGTGTFIYEPDGEANNSFTITNPIYSRGSGAVITIAPSLTGALNLNSPLTSSDGATFNSSASTVNVNAPAYFANGVFNSAANTVNVAAGSGTENGYYAQAGVALAGSGATVNLATGATYNFDSTTGSLGIANSLVLQGNGAILNGQGTANSLIQLSGNSGSTQTLNNLTVENGYYGVEVSYNGGGFTTTLNNVTITGNIYTGLYNYNYSDTLNLNNCTISNNTGQSSSAGAIFNFYGETVNLTDCTISGNGNSSYTPTAGGIANYGTLNLIQTAISGNTGGAAGGIYNTGTVTATDSTYSGNTAATAGADVYNSGNYTVIADGNAAVPNTINYSTSDYNGGTATFLATTINWNVPFTNNGYLTLDPVANGSVTINSPIVNDGGTLLIQAPVITLNAPISSTDGNIVLVDTQQFVNNAGSTALSATGGYTWQVWSVNAPTSGQSVVDVDGGLTPNYIQYDATYGVTSPDSTGNAFFYSNTVNLQVALSGALTKTYDGSTTLTLAPNSYTLSASGQLNNDTVTLSSSNSLTGTLNSKDVDTANTATFDPSQVNFTVVNQGGSDVYGYTLSPFSAPATVTPATVTASLNLSVAESKTYDGTTSATLASNGFNLNGVVGGDSLSLAATTGNYSDQHVGNAKTVTYSGLSLLANSGTDASDYTLGSSSLSGSVGTINPAILTAGLTGTVSKTYDATTTATLTSGNYTLAGIIGSDVVTLNDPTTGTYDTAIVGTGKTVTVTGLAISGTNSSDYMLGSTIAAGAVGVITPSGVQMSLTGSLTGSVSKVYDSTTTVDNLSLSNYTLTGVMPGDTVILSGPTTGTYASSSVGTGILVTSSPGLSLSGAQAANYVLTNNQASGNIGIITPATLTITANNDSKIYSAQPYTGGNGVTYAGFQGSDSAASLAGTLTYSGTSQGAINAGSYTITPGGYTVGNYTYVYNNGSLTIGQAALIVTANSQSKTYGATDPTLTYTVAGLLGSDTAGVVSGVGLNTTTGAAATAGTHSIVTTGGTAQNYTIADVNGILTVSPATLTVTANNDSKTYDGQAYSGDAQGVTYSGFQYTDNAASLGGTLTYSGTSQGAVNAGTYAITPGGYSAGNYTYVYTSGNLAINQAILTAGLTGTVAKTYDATTTATLTTGNYTLAGVIGSDMVALNDPTIGTYDTANVGTGKTVTVTGLAISGTSSGNYTLASTTAAAPIGVINASGVQISLTGSLTGTVSKVYDSTTTVDNLSAANYTLTGVMPGDTVILSGPTTGTYASSSVGAGILVTSSPGLSLSGAQASNYTLLNNQASGNIGIITPAQLTITANGDSKIYNAQAYSGGNGVTYAGFQGSDNATSLAGTLTYSGTSQGATNVGTYTITPGGYTTGNYTYVYNNGNLAISQAALTVTANNQGKIYGAADPTLTYTVTGLLGSDTAGVVSGVGLSTVLGAAATAGTHPITTTGGTAQNYTVADVNGTLTVSPATLTVTANNETETYNAQPNSGDAQGVSYSGFQYTDNAASLPGTLTYSGTSQGAVNAGAYTITPGGYTVGNYTYVYNNGNLTINPAQLTIAANAVTTTYNALPYSGGTVSYTGFQGSDNATSLNGALAYSGTSQGAVNIGTYNITPGGYTSNNYAITYQTGLLTINQAALIVTANNQSKIYGGADPTLTYTVTGLMGSDTVSGINLNTVTGAAATAGTHPIVVTGGTAQNYTVTNVNGTLAVSPATLTVTANNDTQTYSAAPYSGDAQGVSYSGFQYTDSAASLPGTLTYSGTSQGAVNVGTYGITPGGYAAGNYTYVYNSGSLAITPAALIVAANSPTTTYSAIPFSGGSVSYTGLKGADTGASLGGTLTYSGTSQGAVNVGTYPITPGGYTSNNYAIIYQTGTLTINQEPLFVDVTSATITPGSMLPAFNATYAGFVGRDTASSLYGTLVYQTSATSSSPVGSYPVTASGVYDPTGNYLVTIVNGTLTIANPMMNTTPNTMTGGAASGGSNIVPPVINAPPTIIITTTTTTSNNPPPSAPTPPPAPTTGGDNTSDLASALPPPPISFVGAGTSIPPTQDVGGLAAASGNTGQVAKGDIAQINNGQLNNVANPHASGMLNQALGPVVLQNLTDALQGATDFTTDTSAPGADDAAAATADNTDTTGPLPDDGGKKSGGETILSGGDVAEMNSGGVKNIPLSQAPVQLRNAMNGDILKGVASNH